MQTLIHIDKPLLCFGNLSVFFWTAHLNAMEPMNLVTIVLDISIPAVSWVKLVFAFFCLLNAYIGLKQIELNLVEMFPEV